MNSTEARNREQKDKQQAAKVAIGAGGMAENLSFSGKSQIWIVCMK
jgi:hypothetical protein